MRVEMRQHTFPEIMKHRLSIVWNNFRRSWDYYSIYCIMACWPFSMSAPIHIHPWWSPNAKICCHIGALSASWFLLQGQQHYCILFFHANSIFRAPTFVQNSWAVLVKGRRKKLLIFRRKQSLIGNPTRKNLVWPWSSKSNLCLFLLFPHVFAWYLWDAKIRIYLWE